MQPIDIPSVSEDMIRKGGRRAYFKSSLINNRVRDRHRESGPNKQKERRTEDSGFG